MGGTVSAENKDLINQYGYTKRELKQLQKDFISRASDKKNPELTKEQFKNLFKSHVGSEGLKVLLITHFIL